MRQALGIPVLRRTPAERRPWLPRAWTWLFRRKNRANLLQPATLSRQMLRDIGLAEDAVSNPLLSDVWLRR